MFIGGDDIFAIASLETYIQSVTHMYKNIVRGIQTHAELSTYSEVFGISGGISFIRNDLGIVPLVYYFEQSEENLTKAKSVSGKNRIVISKCMMTWDELETVSDLLRQKQEKIFQGLTRQQRMNMYTNIRELKRRILSIHKNTGRKLLTREEEQHVYNIH